MPRRPARCRSGRRLGRGPRGGARRRRSSNESVAKSGRFFSDNTCPRKSPEGRQTYACEFRDDDLSVVCMFRPTLVRRSCLVVMSCGEAEVVVVAPADGRAASWRELGGARPFVRACGVAICDAGRCSAARGRCVARPRAPRAHDEADWESGALCLSCVRARAVSLAPVRAVRYDSCTRRLAARTQPVRTLVWWLNTPPKMPSVSEILAVKYVVKKWGWGRHSRTTTPLRLGSPSPSDGSESKGRDRRGRRAVPFARLCLRNRRLR